MIGHDEATGQRTIIVMNRRHGRTLFGGDFVDFVGGNAVKQLVDDFDDEGRIIDLYVGFFADFLDSLQNLVKRNDFSVPIAFGHKHFRRVFKYGHDICSDGIPVDNNRLGDIESLERMILYVFFHTISYIMLL